MRTDRLGISENPDADDAHAITVGSSLFDINTVEPDEGVAVPEPLGTFIPCFTNTCRRLVVRQSRQDPVPPRRLPC